ncbi:MAG: serpin family protein [Rhabdochlamydiaceae bacterium]|jgi:serpin B
MLTKLFSTLTMFSIALSGSLSADLNSDLSTLTKDHTAFAFSLYPNLDVAGDNLVFSPYSISTCLSMVYLGAREDTQSEMQSTLHLELDRKTLAKTAYALNQSLLPKQTTEKTYQLNMANAIWIDQGTFLLTDFRYAIEEQFKSKLGILNFEMTPTALSTINNWISEQTQGKIPNLLNPNDIDELTRLVLTNAVYFQGAWVSPFNPKATNVAPFHPTPETSVNVKMMHQTFFTSYYENGLMQALSLPFTGVTNGDSNLAFLLLLPKSADNFSTMIDEFSKSYSEWISSLRPFNIDLSLPKFTFSSRYDLQKPLQDLGMHDPFGSNANFTGIDGMRDLFLNKVVHQAFFALDENGVTAAAATAASMNVTSALPSEPPIQFVADHPFLFLIIDLKSQEMLFMGKVVQPSDIK